MQNNFNQKEHLKRISLIIDKCSCNLCEKEFLKQNGLSSHLKHIHKISSKEYYDKLFLSQGENICICGNERKFNSIKDGYNRYCGIKCPKRGKGSDNPNYQNFHKSPSHSEFMKGNNFSIGHKSWNKGKKVILSEKAIENIRKHLKDLNSRGLENKGGRTTFYLYDGLLLQGRYELYFAMNNLSEIKSKPKPIKTPFGFYTPDFDIGDYFVEIKSSYTIKTCINSKQFKKIKWVSNNVKKVKIKIIGEKDVKAFLSTINYKEYIYHKSKIR